MRTPMMLAAKQVGLDKVSGQGNRPTNGAEMSTMAFANDRQRALGLPSLTAPRNSTVADLAAARANEPVGVVNPFGQLSRGGDLGPR